MNFLPDLGHLLVSLGVLLLVLGILLMVLGHVPGLGRLPGDIYIERDSIRFYFPLTTCLLLSLVLSLIIHLLRSLF